MIVILLQQGKGGDIANAFGGGASQAAFGARAGATVLTQDHRTAAFFMVGACAGDWGVRGTSRSWVAAVRPPARAARPRPRPRAATPAPTPAHRQPRTRGATTHAAPAAPGHGARRLRSEPPPASQQARPRRRPRSPAHTGIAGRVAHGLHPSMRKWRNWQTHQLEGLAVAIPWGFESPLPHHSLGTPRSRCVRATQAPGRRAARSA